MTSVGESIPGSMTKKLHLGKLFKLVQLSIVLKLEDISMFVAYQQRPIDGTLEVCFVRDPEHGCVQAGR
jgi:hypothetical protein